MLAMAHKLYDIGVAAQIGRYSDAVETAPNLRWLHTSGTPGLAENRDLPKDITGQSELAWQHVMKLLRDADMGAEDIVKVTQYLTRAEDIADYAKVRYQFLGDAPPASCYWSFPNSCGRRSLWRWRSSRQRDSTLAVRGEGRLTVMQSKAARVRFQGGVPKIARIRGR